MNTEALFDPEGNFLHALSISCEIPTFLPTFITYCLTVVLKKKKNLNLWLHKHTLERFLTSTN